MEAKLSDAITLRENGKQQESNRLLLKLAEEFPDDPLINYQCAWSFDVLGEEANAIPFYEKAIHLGLSGKNLEGALLGLGSTYRTLGMYEESKKIFSKGIRLFPANNAMRTFYAITLYNLKEHRTAMEILLGCLLATTADSNITAYKRALEFYSDKLDETW
ncbi:tetratricopeptide repeat protein [Planococcus lenghuensis]|uniref:Tetratrico peptide repeat group 5 domain-containing protein n=1 Tax=Planococcus lenghuensis TaxID=2213202 RepID=A0A1Q2L557_9BACL|nr:tetratricopeptide repeat protein [Planococcus lenghuensis]AQQ55553.1 hypothetical protein B0X71_20475 [Planococcus lenghuensis]